MIDARGPSPLPPPTIYRSSIVALSSAIRIGAGRRFDSRFRKAPRDVSAVARRRRFRRDPTLIRRPASDGIVRSTITHCTSVNSSSAKTRRDPSSILRRCSIREESSLGRSMPSRNEAREIRNIAERGRREATRLKCISDSPRRGNLVPRANPRKRRLVEGRGGGGGSGAGEVSATTIFGTSGISYATLQFRETRSKALTSPRSTCPFFGRNRGAGCARNRATLIVAD